MEVPNPDTEAQLRLALQEEYEHIEEFEAEYQLLEQDEAELRHSEAQEKQSKKHYLAEVILAHGCSEVLIPSEDPSRPHYEALSEPLVRFVNDQEYRTTVLTDKGVSIIRGILADLGAMHEQGFVHGNISLRYVRVSHWITSHQGEVKRFWRGRLARHGERAYTKSNKEDCKNMTTDFGAVREVIRSMFAYSRDDTPPEVNLLLECLQNPTRYKRGFLYCHPCTMGIIHKMSVVGDVHLLYKGSYSLRKVIKLFNQSWSNARVKKWTKILHELPQPSEYYNSVVSLKADLDRDLEFRNNHPTVETWNAREVFLYISGKMAHGFDAWYVEKLETLYVMFPNFCHELFRDLPSYFPASKTYIYQGHIRVLERRHASQPQRVDHHYPL